LLIASKKKVTKTEAYCLAKVKMEHIYNHADATNFRSCSH